MIRYGAQAKAMRPMHKSELFVLRLRLLIIMMKAYLKGNPFGEFRKKATAETTNEIFYEALFMAEQLKTSGPEAKTQSASRNGSKHPDPFFLQRVQLLSVMANAFTTDKADGIFRKQAMADNIDLICKHLSKTACLVDTKFLRTRN
jgi:hypothetical protein